MTSQSMTDQAEIARLDGEITAACITRDMSTAYAKLQARKAVERRVAVAVAGLVLAFAPAAADAAPQTGSPATLGGSVTHVAKAKPASKALLAKAVSQVKVGEQRLAQTGNIASVTSLSCHGTTKRIVCSLRGMEGISAVAYRETFVVSHGTLSSVRGLVTVASTASVQKITVSQREATQDAQQYLQYIGGFSLTGLVSQLRSDGFSTSDARYGATHAGANWNKEVVQDARQYLQYVGGFSASGLIGQLESDGFTAAQAKYGAKAVGL